MPFATCERVSINLNKTVLYILKLASLNSNALLIACSEITISMAIILNNSILVFRLVFLLLTVPIILFVLCALVKL